MKTQKWLRGLALGGLLMACQAVVADTLDIGTAWGFRGEPVSVPVTLTASVDCTALLARLKYDRAVLENPAVLPGPLLSATHRADGHPPEPGRFNLVVYGATGAPAFTSQSGVVCYLVFDIRTRAPLGRTFIQFTGEETSGLPVTDLTDVVGATVAHDALGGSVMVGGTRASRSWSLYD